MNPNYVSDITIYRKISGAWERTVLHNCFWKSGITVTQNGTEASQVNTYTVRIPESIAGAGFSVSLDDIVINGICPDEITEKSPFTATEILRKRKPDAFKVTAFSDNTSHLMDKHYRLGG